MESYSIFPLLLMVYFEVMAAGCAELPYKTKKRCPLLYYGALTGMTVFMVLLEINLLVKLELPEAGCFDALLFWPCSAMLFVLTCLGMVEVRKRRIQKKLSAIEFCLSEIFLSCSILTFVGYLIYLMITRGTIL